MNDQTTLSEAFEEASHLEAPLNDRLAAYAQQLRHINPPIAEAYDALVERLRSGDVGASAPGPGDAMMPFVLPGLNGRLSSLSDILKHGPAVISFNRGHWCPFCRIELRTLADYHDEVTALGAEIVSIMPDRQRFLKRSREETGQRVHFLSDIDNAYSLSLGLVVWLDERIQKLLALRGHDLATYQGNDGWFVPVPATFVVDRDGRIVGRHVDPDFRKRMAIDDILKVLSGAGGNNGA